MSLLEGEGRSYSLGSPASLLHCSSLKLAWFLLAQERFWGRGGYGYGSTWEMTLEGSPLAELKYILSKVPLSMNRHKRLLPWWGPAGADETGWVQRTELFLPIWACYSWCNSPEFRPQNFSKTLFTIDTVSAPSAYFVVRFQHSEMFSSGLIFPEY